MVRQVMFSVALSAIMIYAILRMQSVYEATLTERVTRVDIFSDRITYRTSQYSSPSLLAIGIKAAQDPPEKLALHDCDRMDDFEAVLDALRDQGYTDLEIELPEGC
jgi:hypothetical protein